MVRVSEGVFDPLCSDIPICAGFGWRVHGWEEGKLATLKEFCKHGQAAISEQESVGQPPEEGDGCANKEDVALFESEHAPPAVWLYGIVGDGQVACVVCGQHDRRRKEERS